MAYQRRIILIDPPFQLRFSLYVVSWIFALSLFYPVLIFEIFDSLTALLPAAHSPSVVEKLAGRRNELISLLVTMQLLFGGVTFLMSIYLSHRIAGPVFKLRKFLSESVEGKLVAPLIFRKADHFQDLVGVYNSAARTIEARIEQQAMQLNDAVTELEGIKASLSGAERQRLESVIARLRPSTSPTKA